jgi:heptosyltransferase I
MGDVLHAMPAVAALREAHPGWFIGWAVEPRWSVMLQSEQSFEEHPRPERRSAGMPMVDLCHPFPVQRWKRRPVSPDTLWEINEFVGELRRERYDVCVDMQGLIRSAVIGRMAGAAKFVGPVDPREVPAGMFYQERVKRDAAHVIEQGCELLGTAVGERLSPAKVSLPVDEAAEAWCYALPGGLTDGRFVMVAPTAGWGAKAWPAERYGAVAAELGRAGYRTLVNAASVRDAVAEKVVQASDGFATAVPCSIGQLIALERRAALVIAGDTGPVHLAAALERPVVGLYGPTDPTRTGPYGTRSRVLRHAESVTNHKRLAEAEDGLLRIGTAEVVEAALELLGSTARSSAQDELS